MFLAGSYFPFLPGDDDVNQILLDESIQYNSVGVDRDFENLVS